MGQLNLLPESYVKERFRYRIDLMCVILFAVVMGSVMGAEAISRARINETKFLHTRVTAQYAEATKFIKAFFELQNERDQLLKEAQIASSMEERVPRSYLLAVIGNALRGTASIEELTIKATYPQYRYVSAKDKSRGRRGRSSAREKPTRVPDLPQPPPIITIDLVGIAQKQEDIGAFIASLRASKLIERLEHKSSRDEMFDNISVTRFTLFMRIKRDVDVLELMLDEEKLQQLPLPDGQAPKGSDSSARLLQTLRSEAGQGGAG